MNTKLFVLLGLVLAVHSSYGRICLNLIKPMPNRAVDLQIQVNDCEQENDAGPPYQKIGSKYYYIEDSAEVNWFEAVAECHKLDGHLANIKNLQEFNAIKQHLQANKHYWLGFSDLAKEGEFISEATGQQITYFNWHGNEPNNGGGIEHCGELWFVNDMHLMNDARCICKEFFICEPKFQI